MMEFYHGIPRLFPPIYPQSNHENELDNHTRFLKRVKCIPVKKRPHWMENVEVNISIFMNVPMKRARKCRARFSIRGEG